MTARMGMSFFLVHLVFYLVQVGWNSWDDTTCQGLDVTLCGSPALTAVDAVSLDFSGNFIHDLSQARNAVVAGFSTILNLVTLNYDILNITPDDWGFQVLYPVILLLKGSMVLWMLGYLLSLGLSLLGRGFF